MSRLELILTYDIGTTACKSVLFGLDGTVVAMAEQEYPTRHPDPMWAEQDPDDWWNAVVSTTRFLMKGREDAAIIGIGLSSQRETIVPVDRQGNKLADAILWMDRRTAKEAQDLASHFGRENLHRVTGMIPDATFSATKLWWLNKNHPDIVRRAHCFLQPKEYVCLKLTGQFTTDYSLASRTMMLDTRRLCWFDDIFDVIGISKDQMPPIYHSDEVVGTVTPEAARLLSIDPGVPVVAGGGDRQCEALGAGIFGDRAMESTGTTSNISCASDHVLEDLDIRVVCSVHTIRGHWLIEQGLTTSGSILRWFRDTFCQEEAAEAASRGVSAYSIIDRQITETPPGSKKLVMLRFHGCQGHALEPAGQRCVARSDAGTQQGRVCEINHGRCSLRTQSVSGHTQQDGPGAGAYSVHGRRIEGRRLEPDQGGCDWQARVCAQGERRRVIRRDDTRLQGRRRYRRPRRGIDHTQSATESLSP